MDKFPEEDFIFNKNLIIMKNYATLKKDLQFLFFFWKNL